MIKVAPSILSADFACLAQEAKRMELSGADCFILMSWTGVLFPILPWGL